MKNVQMIKITPYYLTLSILFITGCSDLGFGSCGEDNCDGSDIISTISLDDFVGGWDGSRDVGSDGYDENYMVVKSSGKVIYYDYQSDSYNLGDDCYVTRTIKLTDTGVLNSFDYPVDGSTRTATVWVELSGIDLSFTFAASDPTTPGRFEYSPAPMDESDFTPLCPVN